MSGSLVSDLGISPEAWFLLSLLACITLFFKFDRLWSVRNLDLLLLFMPAPGLAWLMGGGASGRSPWGAYVLLFVGSAAWLARGLLDLGIARRPLLEPNLNAEGLWCTALGMLGLLVVEAVVLPPGREGRRNPADVHASPGGGPVVSGTEAAPVAKVLDRAPLPAPLRGKPAEVILARIIAAVAHLALVAGLWTIGARHFERPVAGVAMAACDLILPYTRIALVDGGQLIPAALIVWGVAAYTRPAVAGILLGLAGGWMPVCLGLIPIWAGFYWRRGLGRFLLGSLGFATASGLLVLAVPILSRWCRVLGARSLAEVGLWPWDPLQTPASFWAGFDPMYRLPVLVLYLALVVWATLWLNGQSLGELLALSATVLVAGQFWHLDRGGTLIALDVPLLLLVIFRPNLAGRRAGVFNARKMHHVSAGPA